MTDIAMANTCLPDNSSLEALLADFTTFVDVKPQALRTYLNGIRRFMGYARDLGIANPTRETVINFRESLRLDHKPTTIQTYLAGVRRFFQWLAVRGYRSGNIAANVKGVRLTREFKKDCLTADQSRELLESIDRGSLAGKRDYAMLALMITTGLRDCEIARACIEDMQTIAGQSALFIQGKGHDGKDQAVKLAPKVEKAIREYLTTRGETDKGAALFAAISNRNAKGAGMTTRSISRIVKTRLQAIGLDNERLTAHSLRHTAATLNLLNGGTLEETQQLLRHSSINTTQIYSHALTWAGRKSEGRIADAVF